MTTYGMKSNRCLLLKKMLRGFLDQSPQALAAEIFTEEEKK
jgi:hypothetical protein